MSEPRRTLRIVSDGTPQGTSLFDADGEPVRFGDAMLIGIDIAPIRPGELVTATLTVASIGLEMSFEVEAKGFSVGLARLG